MDANELRSLQAPLKKQYREHPETARTPARAAATLELAPALWPRAAHRVQQSFTMVRALDVPVYLCAKESARIGVVRVARYLGCSAVFDGYEHGACIRAVVRAGAPDDGSPGHLGHLRPKQVFRWTPSAVTWASSTAPTS